jgi:DNA-binding transcriptional MerR regulator
MNDAPEKLYYSISEVSDATGVKAHVLRYWESQFPMLRPRKSRGGMRMYRAKDAAIIQRIKYLLYDRGFTIAGARRKLFEDRRSGISYDAFEPEVREEASLAIPGGDGPGAAGPAATAAAPQDSNLNAG